MSSSGQGTPHWILAKVWGPAPVREFAPSSLLRASGQGALLCLVGAALAPNQGSMSPDLAGNLLLVFNLSSLISLMI
ncbi:hypothetical protein Nepgr_008380 [Nepenthes gracilis]|uniref:Uncharacterized protein n=1 Tax=Nepenthes gracilis TaxID=150966 RepID=A0AAD3XJB8_NEPGR|nr:hypothetical protein Nepgr_008380 [Nepenthes gracilis]